MGSRIDLLSLLIVLSSINTTTAQHRETCNNSRTCYNILLLLIFSTGPEMVGGTFIHTWWASFLCLLRLFVSRRRSSVVSAANTVPWHSPYIYTHKKKKKKKNNSSPGFSVCVVVVVFIYFRAAAVTTTTQSTKRKKKKKKEQVLCIHIVTCCCWWCSWLFLMLLSPCCVCVYIYRRCVVHCNLGGIFRAAEKDAPVYTHTHTSVI